MITIFQSSKERRMKLTASVLLSFVSLLTQGIAEKFDYCYTYDQDPYLLMGTKTAYQFVQGRSRLPPVPSKCIVQLH
jgi:hypothetical protein